MRITPVGPCWQLGNLQRRCSAKRDELVQTFGLTGTELGVGIGLHTGELSFGEFGRSHRDLTAIGTVVNLASRAQSVAEAGQILATQAVYERAQLEMAQTRPETYLVKGLEKPVVLYTA